ncbi:MAG: NAD(+) synthase [Pirellulales bacterium]|nr:NAD(+) synthase [Pirellulales bacterium]
MHLIRVAAAVLNQTPLAWDSNLAHILAAIEEARRQEASILCLPELCITGYGCEDAFHAAGTWQTACRVLDEIVPHTRGLVVSVGLPLLFNNAQYNTACLIADGHILGFTAKRFLAGDGIHYEPRWFKPWPAGRRAEITLSGRTFPLGDLHYQVSGVKIGFEICEDAWVANRPGGELATLGADIILNPSASHFAFGKIDVRRRFVLEGSRAFNLSYVYANLLGNEAGRIIYDGGALVASAGTLLAAGPRFSFADYHVTTATIDIDATRMTQARTGSFRPDYEEPANCVSGTCDFPTIDPRDEPIAQAAWETSPWIKQEEFTRAIALALFDYERKSRSRGFVVSLSGGADSAAVSALVAMGVRLGVQELGRERFLQKLTYWPEIQTAADERAIIGQKLTCVYQSTRNSGDVTRQAARAVATSLGAVFVELDVDPLVQGYVGRVEQALGRSLSWRSDDLALQNIQARARAPSVWLLANLRGALLLATSNRSEAAVGYATMDGDTAGGLSPIAGIDKAFIRGWLRWLEEHGPSGLGPWPEVAAVNAQAPTAELRPQAAHQTDEADLMPYELLDAIERAAIRDKRAPLEVYKLVRLQFAHYEPRQTAAWVERFFRLWSRNQWKRERYAPSFHVDDENLDPKTWCRWPILSGSFERELADLRAYVDREA